MKLTQRERRLARTAANVVWWMEAIGSDSDGLLEGDREALDQLRDALAVYAKNNIIMALSERRQPEPEPCPDY